MKPTSKQGVLSVIEWDSNIMIKGSILREDITTLKTYAPNNEYQNTGIERQK